MDIKDLEIKLLPPEKVASLFLLYNACDQLFEGSHILALFQHIMALSALTNLLTVGEQERKQIGWYDPVSKTFCNMNAWNSEKGQNLYKDYIVPVYADI